MCLLMVRRSTVCTCVTERCALLATSVTCSFSAHSRQALWHCSTSADGLHRCACGLLAFLRDGLIDHNLCVLRRLSDVKCESCEGAL
jgi:hypothetical protein